MNTESYFTYLQNKYREEMYSDQVPAWKCPHCGTGMLTVKEEDFRKEETEQSKQERNHKDWEPEWVCYRFSVFLTCTYCKEKTVAIGEGRIEVNYDNNGNIEDCVDKFMPKYFIPPLPLFEIPDGCPEIVKNHLNESFALAWADFSAAGNKFRVALERLMDTIHPDPSGKLTLHSRIKDLPTNQYQYQYQYIKDELFAIKWLGNEGSHQGQLQEHDVAFAYTVFDRVLNKLYKKEKSIKELVDLVNSTRGKIAK